MTIERLVARVVPGLMVVVGASGAQAADVLRVTESQVTTTTAWETTPTLGNDGTSDLVVYSRSEVLPSGGFGPGDIWYQRLANGAASGAPVQVTSGPTDDLLNDVSGDYIVYTAYESTTSYAGEIMLYRISTGVLRSIGSAVIIQEPRIEGQNVVWREGANGSSMVMLYDLAWLGTAQSAVILAGPVPPTYGIDIGDRFVVWSEYIGGQLDVAAFDLSNSLCLAITSTALTDESEPATSGSVIVWQAQDKGATAMRIEAFEASTGKRWPIVDNGAPTYRPSIDGDLVAYESKPAGNLDIFVFRMSTEESFQVTTDPSDQYLNNMHGDLVAYVDQRNGNEDVFISRLELVTPDPCAASGDGDGDGVCDPDDNCPAVANADQADADGDGAGDVCDAPDDPPEPPVTLDPAEICAAESLPAGAVELFSKTWPPPDCEDCAEKIDESFAIEASAADAVFCLDVVGTAGPGQSHAPKGFVTWNEATVFDNVDLRSESSVGAVAALPSNLLRAKLILEGPHHDSTISLRVIEVTAPDGFAMPMGAGVTASAADPDEPAAGGCAATPTSAAALAALALLGIVRRRRR